MSWARRKNRQALSRYCAVISSIPSERNIMRYERPMIVEREPIVALLVTVKSDPPDEN